MPDCDNCGSIRMNGSPVSKTPDGYRPGDFGAEVLYCCRDCAKKLTGF